MRWNPVTEKYERDADDWELILLVGVLAAAVGIMWGCAIAMATACQ
jgi:hypothetical protein